MIPLTKRGTILRCIKTEYIYNTPIQPKPGQLVTVRVVCDIPGDYMGRITFQEIRGGYTEGFDYGIPEELLSPNRQKRELTFHAVNYEVIQEPPGEDDWISTLENRDL